MTSRRELIDAQVFERERLIRAFVSGQVELADPDRTPPGRAFALGLLLTLVVVAGLVVFGDGHADAAVRAGPFPRYCGLVAAPTHPQVEF